MLEARHKIPVMSLYILKLQTSFLYDAGGRKLKGFSEGVYERFSEFSSQDNAHAVFLHGALAEMNANIAEPEPRQTLNIPVYSIEGIGREQPGEGEEKELFIKSARDWVESLVFHEKWISDIIRKNIINNQDMVDLFERHVQADGLLQISENRITILNDFSLKAWKLFTRKKEIEWRCAYCGYIEIGQEAPEECACCHQTGNWQLPGNWVIMP